MISSQAILYYSDHPVEFTKDIIGITPDPIQGDIMRAVAKFPRVSVRSGHGIGKSALESWLIIWYMLTRPDPKIPCTAPTKHQLYDILWAEVAKWLNNAPTLKNELIWTYNKLYLRGRGETWFAVPRTASKPDALQGFHADHVFYIIDEASGVSDSVFEPALGALSTEGAKLLMCGNPTQLSGFFYESHHKNRDLYQTFGVSSADSPRVDPSYVQMIIDMFGEDSDVFRVRVAGEFPKSLSDSFIPLDWVEKNSVKEPLEFRPERIDIGVDVARFGEDETIICPVFDLKAQQRFEVLRHNDTMRVTGALVQKIKSYLLKYPEAKINVKVDCDGLGVGVYDRLDELTRQDKELANIELYEMHFGGRGGRLKGDDPVDFANATGLMWGSIREGLRYGTLTLYDDVEQTKQIATRRYSLNSAGQIVLERKEELTKRKLSSPDRADALALALYTPRSAMSF